MASPLIGRRSGHTKGNSPCPASTLLLPAPRGRRLAAWLAFGAVGLATGAVWASGFASISAGNGNTDPSPAVTKGTPAVATSSLSGTVTDETPLSFDWAGRWGSIAADTLMFTVDLSDGKSSPKTYNIAVLLANTSVLTGWASLQLEIERVDVAARPAPATPPRSTARPIPES